MTRYGLCLRRTTNLTVLGEEQITARAVRLLTYRSLKKGSLNPSGTFLMDETAVLFEDPRRDTVDFTGARHVVLSSTVFALTRITVSLTVTTTGTKLPRLLIWKGAREKTIQKSGAINVSHQGHAWINSDLLLK